VRLTLDTDAGRLTHEAGGRSVSLDLYSTEAFELVSQAWLKLGWNLKYTYTFTWLGRPIIQLPEDMVRAQEVIHRVRPAVIVETGVAHGGSLVFYASLCRLLGHGRVIGVDVEIRPHNRRAIEAHPLAPLITLVEGDAVAPATVARVKSAIAPGESAIVFLDSRHTRAHVLAELEAYHDLVSPGSYIVATDGIMRDLAEVPRGKPEWAADNPAAALAEFVRRHPEFVLERPAWPFNESPLTADVTHRPGAWARRRDGAP
jgi:cephalosporin hydroxylase